MIIKIALLVALTRLLAGTDNWKLCTGLYAAFVVVYGLVTGVPVNALVIAGGISIGVLGLYYWLLYRLQSGLLYWLVFVLGIPVCIFT